MKRDFASVWRRFSRLRGRIALARGKDGLWEAAYRPGPDCLWTMSNYRNTALAAMLAVLEKVEKENA